MRLNSEGPHSNFFSLIRPPVVLQLNPSVKGGVVVFMAVIILE